MSSLKDIKIRIKAIDKTATITQAMHNIALSKIKKSTDLLNHSKEFSNKIADIVKVAHKSISEQSRYTGDNLGDKKLYILISGDRGLCGSYHNQLFKAFLEEIKDLKGKFQVLVIGKKGFYFVQKQKFPMINQEIIYNRDDISTLQLRKYADIVKNAFRDGYSDEVILFHNHYVNTASQIVQNETILPFKINNETKENEYVYDTDPLIVIDRTMNIYIEGKIFEALADAKLSESAARMIAMKNATDNAHQIVDKLHMQYHRARQQEITSELIDVINGSNV